MNPFMPDRSAGIDGVRHVPDPPQGNTLIFSGGTPSTMAPLDVTTTYGNDMQPISEVDAAPPFLDATERLASEGYFHKYLNSDPRVADFPKGPGDMDRNDAGWE